MTGMISLAQARDLVAERVGILLEPENVPLLETLGRRLATEICADTPWPTTDRSAMDGFAVCVGASGLEAGTCLPVAGESLAGHPFSGHLKTSSAIRIMTGAVVPQGANAVVPVEDTSGFGAESVTLSQAVHRGQCIRAEGSEVGVGEVLLQAGTRIRAAEVGALAVLGIDPVPVTRRPRVAILSTGDEVVEIHRVPQPHQVRDSNAQALAAQVLASGGVPQLLGIAGDDAADLRQRMVKGLDEADVLLTIGGVSVGTHDLVHGTLSELGVVEVFHGVALKPGKPTFFGERTDGDKKVFVFGLPGNPASSFTVFDLLVRPLLHRITGAGDEERDWQAHVAGAPFKPNRRLQAVPAALVLQRDGSIHAHLTPPRPSGDPFGLLAGDGYALVPSHAEPGSVELTAVTLYSDGLASR